MQASTQLAQAANIIGSQTGALQLRYLQTLTEIAVEKNSTIIFPLPMDIIEPFLSALPKAAEGNKEKPRPIEEQQENSIPLNAYLDQTQARPVSSNND